MKPASCSDWVVARAVGTRTFATSFSHLLTSLRDIAGFARTAVTDSVGHDDKVRFRKWVDSRESAATRSAIRCPWHVLARLRQKGGLS